MPQGQVLQHLSPWHPDGCQGHPDPAAGDTQVSPWLLLLRHYIILYNDTEIYNISYGIIYYIMIRKYIIFPILGSPGLDIQT